MSNKLESSLFEPELLQDPNLNYDKLENILTEGYEKCFPIKRKRFNNYKHKINPWITKGIMHSIKFKDSLYKKLKSVPPDSESYSMHKINLNTNTKILQKTIRSAKFSYHFDIFNKCKNDCKKLGRTLMIYYKGKNPKVVYQNIFP